MTFRRLTACVLTIGWALGMPCAPAQGAGEKEAILFAHRGGAHEFDENTMAAFRASYEKGLRGFETDVRMTKDGVLVILHDDKLDRTHAGTGPVEEKTAAELRSVRSKKTGAPLVFLDELLAYFADKPGIYLELEMKTRNTGLYPDGRLEAYCRALLEAVGKRKPAGSTYVFTSFDERPLRTMKPLDPEADLLKITDGPCTPEAVARAKALGARRIGCRMDGTSRAAVREAQKAGLLVSGWPGHTLQDYHLAVGLGLDAICTDIPVMVQEYKARQK